MIAEFIERLWFVNTNNYNSLTNLNTLQITTAHIKSSQYAMSSLVIAWYCLLAVEIPVLLCSWLTSDCDCLFLTHNWSTESTASYSSSSVAYISVAMGKCSPSHCLAMDISSGSSALALRHQVTVTRTAKYERESWLWGNRKRNRS
jgi:hypothetical protein